MRSATFAAVAGAVAGAVGAAIALASGPVRAAEPIRIALIEEDGVAAQHGAAGFRAGLEAVAGSPGAVIGRPLELAVIAAGDDPVPRLRAAYADGRADLAVSLAGSAATLAMVPEAAAAQRVLLVAAASADAITGAARNRYVFRTAASDGQIALAAVLAFARPQQNLMLAVPDTPEGHDAASSFKAVLAQRQSGAFFVGVWPLPVSGAGLLDAAQAQYDGLHNLHEARTLVVLGRGGQPLLTPLIAAEPGHFGVRLALAGPFDPGAAAPAAALDGVTPYAAGLAHNALNDRLVALWQARFHQPPDGAAADGMTAALAVVAALEAAGSAESEALVAALEGLRFASPHGELVLRKSDHQAAQPIDEIHIEPTPAGAGVTLIREFSPSELTPPGG